MAKVDDDGVRLKVQVRGAEACPDFGVVFSATSAARCTLSGGVIYDSAALAPDGSAEIHFPLSRCHTGGSWLGSVNLRGQGFSPPAAYADASFRWRGADALVQPQIAALEITTRRVAEGTVADAIMTIAPTCGDLPLSGYLAFTHPDNPRRSLAQADLRREGDRLVGCALIPNAAPPGELLASTFGVGAWGGCDASYYDVNGTYQEVLGFGGGPIPTVRGARFTHPLDP